MQTLAALLGFSLLSLPAVTARAADPGAPRVESPPRPAPPEAPRQDKPTRAGRVAGIALIGIGGAGLAGGLISFAAAVKPVQFCDGWSCPSSPSSSGSAEVIGGIAALSGGAMLMGVGFLVFFANREPSASAPAPRPTAALRPTRSGADFVVSF